LICLHYYQINNDQKFQKRIQKHYSFKIITDPYNKKSDPYNCKNESNQLNSYTILGSERLKKVMNLWTLLRIESNFYIFPSFVLDIEMPLQDKK
jgi:hypothetical protein